MKDSQPAVGERLRKVRKSNGLSQSELGDLLGLGKSAISQIESGINKLSYEHAVTIAEHLGINVQWLLYGGNDDPTINVLGNKIKGNNNVQSAGGVSYNKGNDECEKELAVAQAKIVEMERTIASQKDEISFLRDLLKK